jgi:CheY-like chemotaxis protein
MNGDLQVKSEKDIGTTVTIVCFFDIDKHEHSITTDQSEIKKKKKSLKGLSILVMEDNLVNQKILVKILGDADALVNWGADGSKGVDLYRKHGDFDLILMDCHMPLMDGFEATEILRKEGCKLPIVALTANAAAENVERCLKVGMDDFLAKPVKPSKLVAKILEWVSPTTASH